MIMRVKTSGDIESKLSELDKKIKLSSKAALMRIAIACSVREKGDPRIENDTMLPYESRSQGGADYQRFTIFGQNEDIYKLLMIQNLGHKITDEEFFPDLTNAHIRRGIRYMYSEYSYIDNRDKFFESLINLSR